MPKSNLAVSHTDRGFLTADVVRAGRISPSFVRLTICGEELSQWRNMGFDQWFRLAVPVAGEATRFDRLSKKFNMAGYLRYLSLPKSTRPEIRNYTVRAFRPDVLEMDIDFVTHQSSDPSKAGVAGPWAESLPVGARVGLIDQGCGYRAVEGAKHVVLVGDESALPAILGILRDLPADSFGDAIVEVPNQGDIQPASTPAEVNLRWVVRTPGEKPGEGALSALRELPEFPGAPTSAFVAGEQTLATEGRRHLVTDRELPKADVDFCGYWRR